MGAFFISSRLYTVSAIQPMRTILSVILLLLLQLPGLSQTVVKGKVVDEQQQPVPYATVGWVDGSTGTATNEVGEFSLQAPALPQRMVVLSMGYGRAEAVVTTAQTPVHVVLKASAVALPEVTVRNPNKVAEELVMRAAAKLLRHQQDLYYGKAFYRQKTRQNGRYREFFDAFYDVKFSNRVIEGWDLGESRYAYVPGGFVFRNFSTIIRRVPVYSRHAFREKLLVPLGQDPTSNFRFTLRTILSEAGRETAVIDFAPRPEVHKPASSGTLYIDMKTAVVRRQEQALPLTSMITMKSNGDYQRLSDKFWLAAEFTPVGDSLSRLTSTRAEATIVMGRAGGQPDSTRISAYLFFYQYTGRLPGHAYEDVGRHSDDMEQVKAKAYNPQFWQQNEVLLASPVEQEVIRDFEGRNTFGKF